jgi:hypothetical protein
MLAEVDWRCMEEVDEPVMASFLQRQALREAWLEEVASSWQGHQRY